MPVTTFGSLVLPDTENDREKVDKYNTAIDAIATRLYNAPKARAFHSASQSIGDATPTALALNSERYDTDVIHDTSTNNSRLTCKTAGKYVISGTVEFAANATGLRAVSIRLNGSTFLAVNHTAASASALVTVNSVTTQYALAVNDYVELMAFQNSGGSLNVNSSGNYSPEFAMTWIGV